MELRDFILAGLERARQSALKSIEGLSWEELRWRPGPGANPIGLILFHQARLEDSFVQARFQGKPLLYESDRWYDKMGLPPTELGAHYTAEQVNAFKVPEPGILVAYGEAVRKCTAEYLGAIHPGEFDKFISTPRSGQMSIAAAFAFILVHSAEHVGDISYLRGLQRGLDR